MNSMILNPLNAGMYNLLWSNCTYCPESHFSHSRSQNIIKKFTSCQNSVTPCKAAMSGNKKH